MLKRFWQKYKKEVIQFAILMTIVVLVTKLFQYVSPVYARYAPRMIFGGLVDVLVFLFLKRTFYRRRKKSRRVWLTTIYFIPEILLLIILFIISFIKPLHQWAPSFRGMITGLTLVLFYCKIIMYFIILLGYIHVWIGKRFSFFRRGKNILQTYVRIGIFAACFGFLVYLVSIPVGQNKLVINSVDIPIQNLPKSFENYKIVHLSDLHFGSLYSQKRFSDIVDSVNALNPDLICLTGDFVIHNAEEAIPFLPSLKRLKAKDGRIYCVLGNHDYMAYSYFKGQKPGDETKLVNLLTNELGWIFLNNETSTLRKEDDSLILAGVENISKNPYFESKGDIDKTLRNINSQQAVIMLLHDPSVWDSKIVNNYPFVSLTLSGHTHGFQYFVSSKKVADFAGKITNSYQKGLYCIDNQYLYINAGIGTTMFRGRLGAWMEITEINLKEAK
ncbi:metallophosphoesterase [Bacteroidales bacterium OttesenSCG-928-C19]|nr:metallophosphoesterase [Bacteroidales bacterium OttesenSCG-928-C19]